MHISQISEYASAIHYIFNAQCFSKNLSSFHLLKTEVFTFLVKNWKNKDETVTKITKMKEELTFLLKLENKFLK